MIADLERVIRLMQTHGVRCIVIGGWVAIIHGAASSTNDVDLVYARDADNIRRLVEAVRTWNPYLRGVPPGLPFLWDEATVRAGLNFTLTTSQGDLDLLGEVAGGELTSNYSPSRTKLQHSASPLGSLHWND